MGTGSSGRDTVPRGDLEAILADAPWQALEGTRLFLTGGTGFFGTWFLQALAAAREHFHLDLEATVLTRDAAAAAARLGALPGVRFLEGDVRSFPFPPEPHTHLLHLATPASSGFQTTPAGELQAIITAGTARVLECSARAGVTRALLASSGAVYGTQPPDLERIPEDYPGPPVDLTPYGAGKREAEQLAAPGLAPVVARCFAFLGPHLPLDQHFAAGNFLGDALAGRPIQVRGDGRPVRSYLYPTDLITWLVTLLVRGQGGRAYNVGAEEAVSLGALAEAVAALTGVPVQVLGAPGAGPAPRYVPDTGRARRELGLTAKVDLAGALARTLQWHRRRPE